jgi:transposase InsO family protein
VYDQFNGDSSTATGSDVSSAGSRDITSMCQRRSYSEVEPREYTSLAFTEALLDAGIAGSIGTVGDALDNALTVSTIGLYRTELINTHRRV